MVIPKTIPAVVTTPPVAGERADDAGAQAGAGLFANLHGQQQIVVGPDSHERRAGDLGGPSVHQVSLQLGTGSLFREPHLARVWPHGQPFDHRLGRHPAVEIATGVLAKRRGALDIAHVIHDLEGEGELVGVTRQARSPSSSTPTTAAPMVHRAARRNGHRYRRARAMPRGTSPSRRPGRRHRAASRRARAASRRMPAPGRPGRGEDMAVDGVESSTLDKDFVQPTQRAHHQYSAPYST